jgi:plasmid stability protein
MPVIYSRNCPEELYNKVKALAAANRRSFGQEILVLLDQAVNGGDPVKRRLEALERIAERRRRNPQPPGAVDTLTLLREDRAR